MHNDKPPIAIGDRLELFVDDVIVDRLEGVERRLHEPRRMPLSTSPLDEGVYLTILKENNRFRAYYRGTKTGSAGGGRSGNAQEVTCCEESGDGIDWTQPDRGLCPDSGLPHAIFDPAPFAHNLSPFLDERPGVPGEERYKALAGLRGDDRGHLCAFVSADGFRWRRLCGEPAIRWDPEVHLNNAFDSQNVSFWSPAEGRYVAYFRHMGLRAGDRTLRTIGRAVSDDFIAWRDESESFQRPNLPGEELYTSQTHPYFRAPHIYIALPTRFTWGRIGDQPVTNEEGRILNKGSTEIAFMTTRAGSGGYDRLFKESFIRPGLDPAGWANRANYVGLNVVPTGEGEMSIYHRNRHRYVLRTDGFVSIRAPFDGGEFVTRSLVYRGRELVLNMSTGLLGGIRVELRTEEGRALPGCAFEDCRPLLGDRIEAAVAWNEGGQVARYAGQPVRVAFRMNDCDLYSLRFR